MTRRVMVWDPSQFNPYGAEVARIIAENGHSVSRWCRADRPNGVDDGVKSVGALPQAAQGAHTLGFRLSYAAGIGAMFISAFVRRPVLVVTWTNSALEEVAISILQRFRVRTLIVAHNPVPSRDDAQPGTRKLRIRSGASVVIVHTPELAAQIDNVSPVQVAPHPAYSSWVASMGQRREAATDLKADFDGRSLERSATFVGSARADKGVGLLPDLAAALEQHGIALDLLIGLLEPDVRLAFESIPNMRLVASAENYVDDYLLYDTLRNSPVMVAPYTQVTMSGTVILAVTLGVPVVAFRSDGLVGVLPDSNLIEGESLAAMSRRVSRIIVDGDAKACTTGHDLDRASAAGWRAAMQLALGDGGVTE